MKAAQIYVGINGAKLELSNGQAALAVYPPQKGDPTSYILMESGKMGTMKGARINGVGVPRWLGDNGFELAQPDDKHAARLADLLDVREGTKLVEEASQVKAAELQRLFGGQACTFVPFEKEKKIVSVTVKNPDGGQRISCDFTTGLSCGTVSIRTADRELGWDAPISSGWLVGPEGDAASLPRNTEYGGLVEKAVYVICNAGLGSLIPGHRNLVMDDSAAVDAPVPRGMMAFMTANGDRVEVGDTALDVMRVVYRRAGEEVYSREGFERPRLAEIIGSIMAVIVRIGEMDAASKKRKVKKAA